MTAAGTHDSKVTREKLLGLCKIIVLPAATNGIHLTSQSDTVQNKSDKLEEDVVCKAFGMLTPTRRVGLRVVVGLETLEQIKGSAAANMIKRIKARPDALQNNGRAQADKKMLDIAQRKLRLPLGWTQNRMKDGYNDLEQKLKRR